VDEKTLLPGPLPASLNPTTTAEQNRATAGQRSINRIWEQTQAIVTVVIIVVTASGVLAKVFLPAASNLPSEWWAIVGLVIGFYFSRTNHTKIGGVPMRTSTEER